MISKQDLKDYEFSDLGEYFEYVVESQINGNFEQVKRLINDMSSRQKKDFLHHLEYASGNAEYIEKVKNQVINQL